MNVHHKKSVEICSSKSTKRDFKFTRSFLKHPAFCALPGSVRNLCFLLFSLAFVFSSCSRAPEMTLSEIEAYKASRENDLIEKTVSRPWKDEPWKDGKPGGEWNTSISGDPKSFNFLIAERDGETAGILSYLTDYLVDYNTVQKKWVPRLASFEVKADEKNGTMDVFLTLRDDLYWSFYQNAKPRVKVTSDDVVFWYNEIMGDEEMGSSAFNSQFMEMEDGSEKKVEIEKIDDRKFVFHFPRIVADPLLAINMDFGPAFQYKAAKDSGGAQAVKNLNSVAVDPKTLPSLGAYFITEYTPGQRVVYSRNDDFWEKDGNGASIRYPDRIIATIIGDNNTKYLLFKQGKQEAFSPSPEQLEDIVKNASNNLDENGNAVKNDSSGYTVFNAGGSMSAPFWTFNQNPKNKDAPYYSWFTKKEFRQAMSCLLNRERIISQTYRGLAEAKYGFFPEANAFYNEEIILPYRFSHAHAEKLLEQAGFKKDAEGFLRDENGNKVEFDLSIVSSQPVISDIAQIISDECKKEGITINVRQTDFQRLVEQLTSAYDWQSLIIGLGGGNIFPTQGSNVWVSGGNLHMWYPLQKEPATEWEKRVDYLYNTAKCIVDTEKARPLWEEYQRIYLEQCPIIYLVSGRSFFAISNRWNLSNVYFDNQVGAQTDRAFLN